MKYIIECIVCGKMIKYAKMYQRTCGKKECVQNYKEETTKRWRKENIEKIRKYTKEYYQRPGQREKQEKKMTKK